MDKSKNIFNLYIETKNYLSNSSTNTQYTHYIKQYVENLINKEHFIIENNLKETVMNELNIRVQEKKLHLKSDIITNIDLTLNFRKVLEHTLIDVIYNIIPDNELVTNEYNINNEVLNLLVRKESECGLSLQNLKDLYTLEILKGNNLSNYNTKELEDYIDAHPFFILSKLYKDIKGTSEYIISNDLDYIRLIKTITVSKNTTLHLETNMSLDSDGNFTIKTTESLFLDGTNILITGSLNIWHDIDGFIELFLEGYTQDVNQFNILFDLNLSSIEETHQLDKVSPIVKSLNGANSYPFISFYEYNVSTGMLIGNFYNNNITIFTHVVDNPTVIRFILGNYVFEVINNRFSLKNFGDFIRCLISNIDSEDLFDTLDILIEVNLLGEVVYLNNGKYLITYNQIMYVSGEGIWLDTSLVTFCKGKIKLSIYQPNRSDIISSIYFKNEVSIENENDYNKFKEYIDRLI